MDELIRSPEMLSKGITLKISKNLYLLGIMFNRTFGFLNASIEIYTKTTVNQFGQQVIVILV